MKLGVYNAVLHDRSLDEAIATVASLGLTGIELNVGGFLPPVHVPNITQILESDTARDEFLGKFDGTGVSPAGLNCNGNPLHPNPEIGTKHGQDVVDAVKLAHRLGQNRVVTMSGLPGGEPVSLHPNWVVNAWNSGALDVLEYQWEILGGYWTEVNALAADLDVKIALELHPQNLVFNVQSIRELVERIGATHIGVELDASHLFWQQMDPVAVAKELGDLVVHTAAKDVRINPEFAQLNGVLDNSFRRLGTEEPRVNLGGDEWVNEWPKKSAWDFVAVGKGHDVEYWAEFLSVVHEIDPEMWVVIEHEDVSLGREEGLQFACDTLFAAQKLAGSEN